MFVVRICWCSSVKVYCKCVAKTLHFLSLKCSDKEKYWIKCFLACISIMLIISREQALKISKKVKSTVNILSASLKRIIFASQFNKFRLGLVVIYAAVRSLQTRGLQNDFLFVNKYCRTLLALSLFSLLINILWIKYCSKNYWTCLLLF